MKKKTVVSVDFFLDCSGSLSFVHLFVCSLCFFFDHFH